MKSSAIGLGCLSLFLATTTFARAATSFEPLRLVSAVDPAVEPWATPSGDSYGMQLAPDGAWVLYLSDASNVTTNLHQDYNLDLYFYDRSTHLTTLISVDPAGAAGGDSHTTVGQATPDGRYVTFESEASNLVPDIDGNFSSDVFVRDLTAGTTRLVSMNWEGTEAGLGDSVDPVITPDGRYVAFSSTAEDLVEEDTNGLGDVFVRDLVEETTELISVGSISSRFDPDYFYGSGGPLLSADGRWVAFSSTATNMVPGVTNIQGEIYVRDRLQGTTICPSQIVFDQWEPSQVAQLIRRRAFSPSLSDDGGYLVFLAEFTARPPALVREERALWRFEIASGEVMLITTNVTLSTSMEQTIYTMSSDGRWVAFLTAPDSASNDIELWDGDTGETILATLALDGVTGANGFCDMPELSADGRFLVFTSSADNLVTNTVAEDGDVNVFVRDLVNAQTVLVTADATGIALGGAGLAFPAISHDGEWVSFDSYSSGFVPGDRNFASDVFLHPRATQVTELVSRADPAAQSASGNGHSHLWDSPFSDDGSRLVFRSESDDLATGLLEGLGQLYVYDVAADATTLVSLNLAGDAGANAWCYDQAISGDGQTVAFTSVADNLAQGDTNEVADVFVRDLVSQSTTLISRSPQTSFSGNDWSGYPALSHDGQWVTFLSTASDLVEPQGPRTPQAFLHDRQSQITLRVTDPAVTTVQELTPKLSPSGRFLAYVDTHWPFWPGEAWLYDHQVGQREEILPGAAIAALGGDYFSRDGNVLVTWGSEYDDQGRSHLFLVRRHLNTGSNEQIALGPNRSLDLVDVKLDDVGRFVAFSTSLDLVLADTNQRSDVYFLDFASATLALISLNSEGTAAGGARSWAPSISGDGRLVAFVSEADDLVQNDTNGTADIFVFDRHTGTLAVASVNPDGSVGDERSGSPHLSPHGYRLAFTSLATGLVPRDFNYRNDVFLTTVQPYQIGDTDDDGMADGWETNYFGNLAALPEVDSDLDGFPNLDEYIAGTDPVDRLSHLRMEITADESSNVRLHWAVAPGRTYVLESTLDLVSGEWTATLGVIQLAGIGARFEDAESRESPTYYRLQITNETGP